MSRKVIIAGNWKMNKTAAEGKALVDALKPLVADVCPDVADIVVCPTFTTLAAVIDAVKGSNIKVGAQNVHWAESGAFTGEISAAMLKELGVEYVILGHSERRQYFGETDETVNKRLKAALAAKGDAASVTYGDAPSIELPAGATLADLEAALSISDDFTYVVKSGADAVTGATTPLTAEMTLRLFTGDSPVANGVFAIKLKEETPATTTTTATPTTAATSPTSGTADVPATGGGLPWPALLLLPAAGLALALAAGRKRAAR